MLNHILVLLLVATTLIAAGAPSVAFAAGEGHYLIARRDGGESGVSLNEAVQQVKRETGGRVLSAETVNQGGRTVHRIKVLTPSGQVRVVVIDAQSKGR
jgi:uncharacterized membrane protein YkoI